MREGEGRGREGESEGVVLFKSGGMGERAGRPSR